MAAPSFGSAGGFLGGSVTGTTANVDIPVPPGVAVDDILLVPFYVEDSGVVITPPGPEWAEAGSSPFIDTIIDFAGKVYWKRATAADTGTYAFTVPAEGVTWRSGIATRWTGCIKTGNPFDATNSITPDSNTSNTGQAVSLTTTGPDRRIVHVGVHYDTRDYTGPTGFTTHVGATAFPGDVALGVSSKAQVTAGATGSCACTWSGTTGVHPNQSWLGALIPVPAVANTTQFFAMF
jgi:hypothetical protein